MDEIHVIYCPICKEDASGPNLASVKEAIARHQAKKHPKKVEKTWTPTRKPKF